MTYNQLTSEQRYTISILLQHGMKQNKIAEALKVSPSTISRELRRNSGKRGCYNYETAQRNADYHRHRKSGNRTISTETMMRAVYYWLPSSGLQSRFREVWHLRECPYPMKPSTSIYAKTGRTEESCTSTADTA